MVLALVLLVMVAGAFSQSMVSKRERPEKEKKDYPKSLADYGVYKDLVMEVEAYRAERLVDLETFIEMSQDSNALILDTRTKEHFERKHIKGSVHLEFANFTQGELGKLIPQLSNKKILIYCNNNFVGDQIDFATKSVIPMPLQAKSSSFSNPRSTVTEGPVGLALNIPTFINLYGYGYRDIYELGELVNVNDARITFEGTEVN